MVAAGFGLLFLAIAPVCALADDTQASTSPLGGIPDQASLSPGAMLVRVALGLGMVLGILAAVLFLYRKATRGGPGPRRDAGIRVVTQRSLGQRVSLAVVQVAGETLLLGITPQQINALARINAPAGSGKAPQPEVAGPRPAEAAQAPKEFPGSEGPRATRDRDAVNALLGSPHQPASGFEDVLAGEVRRVREGLWTSLRRLDG
jgi:flagellar protein FliO/FliZ